MSDDHLFIYGWNPDGTLDPSFDAGFGADSSVADIAVQLDGKILIGGSFILVGNLPIFHCNIASLTPPSYWIKGPYDGTRPGMDGGLKFDNSLGVGDHNRIAIVGTV